MRGRLRARDDRLGGPFLALFVAALAYGLVLPILPAMLARMGVADIGVATGKLMGAYALATVIFSPLWGLVLDGRRARAIAVVGLVGQAVALTLLPAPATLSGLYLTRALQGALAAAIMPAVLTMAARNAPAGRHPIAVASATRAALLGGLAGPLVGGVLARDGDITIALAVTSVLTGIAVVIVLAGRSDETPRKQDPPDPVEPVRAGLLARLAFAAVAAGLVMGAMEVGIAVRGREVVGMDAGAIGVMFSGCGLVMIIVQALVFRPRTDATTLWRLLGPAFLLSASGLVILAIARQAWVLSLVVALVAGGGGILLPTISLWIVRCAGRAHGFQLGLRAALGGLGQAAGAAAAGYAFRAEAPVLGTTLVLVAASVAGAWIVRRRIAATM